MESESYQETKPERKRGITLMGYFIPWHIALLVLVCVAVYFAHEQGYLAGMTGTQKSVDPVELQGPVLQLGGASTPEEVRRLFNSRW